MPASRAGWRATAVVVAIALAVIAIDQLTKWWATRELAGQPPVQVVGEWLQLTFVRNPGGAFSLGTNFTWLFSIVAAAVAVAILVFSRTVTSGWWRLALGVLLGGAVGNLIDRVVQPPSPGQGHVVDFLQLPNWPVFNVADMAVVGGATTIVILSLLGVEPSRRATGAAAPEPAELPAS